jgi:gamma-glutamylcyclotransferase (GGCT)/AIG2-like uncharacterized protein YtfP
MDRLFAYGTLMWPEILEEVAGCRLPSEPATLRGYARRAVRGESYPGIVEDPGGRVEGVLYRGVPPQAWDRLDRFEGEMYARTLVQAELADGIPLPAGAYVVKPAFRDRLDAIDWDPAAFARRDLARFRRGYPGFGVLAPGPGSRRR